MSETKFDFYKPWRIDDLPENIRGHFVNICSDYFESGATYVGDLEDGVGIFEVPHCPYCGMGTYKMQRCKHVVCVYDSINEENLNIDPDFETHVMNIMDGLVLKGTAAGTESFEDAFFDIQSSKFPRMYLLADIIKGFSFHQISEDREAHGMGVWVRGRSFIA